MEAEGVKILGYRWVILGAFMFINLTIQILWICFAPISGMAAAHYGVSDMRIGLLAMIFMVVYIPTSIPASWLIDKFGFRKAVGFGAVLLGVFGLLRAFLADDYEKVFLCTIGIALAQPLILNSYTTMAAKWFPIGERASASGMAMAACFIGTAIGLMLTPYLATKYGIASTQMIYGIITAFSALIFLVLVRESLPTPQSSMEQGEKALMFEGIRIVLKNRDLWFGLIMFFVGNGIFNGVATWIEDIVRPKGMTIGQAGILGGVLLIGGIFGAAVIPTLSDRYRRRKPFMLLGIICAIPGLLGFTFFHTYLSLLASIFALGFFMIGVAPIAFQYAAEITFPMPEGTSNGLLMLVGQLSVVFIFAMAAMNKWLGSFKPSLLLGVGLMVVNCVLISQLHESKLLDQIKG